MPAAGFLNLRKASGTITIAAAQIQRPIEIGLSHRMPSSPLVMDSARRRFCSIISPSTKPRISGAIGISHLRSA